LWNFELFEKTLSGHQADGEGRSDLGELKTRLSFYSGVESRIEGEAIASHFHELSVSDFDELSPSALESIVSDRNLVLSNEDSLFDVIHRQSIRDLSYFGLLEFVRFEFLSDSCIRTAFEFISSHFELITLGIWSSVGRRLTGTSSVTPSADECRFSLSKLKSRIVPGRLDSEIISDFPSIFTVFEEQQFGLLYRGSRDGFKSADFHRCCDHHGGTLTVVMSDNGSIFGGYTPIAWTSTGGYVSDSKLRSFLFTIKNQHNLSARIFGQKEADYAIYNTGGYGPIFGRGHDLYVCNECQTSKSSYTNLGSSYNNDTGLSSTVVFTGGQCFQAKEVEVFEVSGTK
jgi:hypothetical protein